MNEKRRKGLPVFPGALSTYSLLTILIMLEGLFILMQSFYLARAITFLFQQMVLQDVFLNIVYFFLFYLLRYIIVHLEEIIAEKYSFRTRKYLRKKLLQQYFHTSTLRVQKTGTGHVVQLLMEGIDHVQKYIEIIGIRMIRTCIIPAMIVIYIFLLDRSSAVILVVTVPIIIVFMILLGLAAEKMADKQYTTYTRLANHFVDSLKGLETLAFLGKSKEHGNRIEKVSNDYKTATMKTLRIAFLSSFALDFFTSLSIAFVAVGLGLRLIDGAIVLLPALTILLLAPEYFSPIKQVGKDYHATLDGQVALANIEAWIEEKEVQKEITSHIPLAVETLELAGIHVETEENKILKDVDLSIRKGLHVIIGESGAGKTTLLQLLSGRLAPTEGNFVVNGCYYHSLRDNHWFEQIAYIPQHPYIFPLSLLENLRFYEPTSSEADVYHVLKKVGLEPLVNEFPNGIYEQIGEAGRALSGGQEQRVAIARALLSKKQIILLDEPTAHLDVETEYEVKQLILQLIEERFVILTTHRLHWVNNSDYVSWIDEGEIKSTGKHKELLEQDDLYRSYYEEQRGGRHD